jgi:hypothetical protein
MESMRRRGRRDKQLLDDLNEKRGYCKLKEKAPTGTLWRIRCGRDRGPVAGQTVQSYALLVY